MSDWRRLETFSFGGSDVQLADDLARLVVDGRKTATCWAAVEGKLTDIGTRMVMLDGGGRPRAIIETIELTLRRFDQVDPAFACEEGEGDRTLETWRRNHRIYFTRRGQFSEDMLLYCERFRVVGLIAADPT